MSAPTMIQCLFNHTVAQHACDLLPNGQGRRRLTDALLMVLTYPSWLTKISISVLHSPDAVVTPPRRTLSFTICPYLFQLNSEGPA
jgi:hypothetical protein